MQGVISEGARLGEVVRVPKRVALLSRADECELRGTELQYNTSEGLSYIAENGNPKLAVLSASAPPTQSKTMAEPGDDDPDPDDDRCY
jgi:hypothetical protein